MAKKYPTRTKDEQRDAEAQVKRVIKGFESYDRQTQTQRGRVVESFGFNYGGRKQWKSEDAAKLDSEKRPVSSFNLVAPIVNFIAGYQADREQDYRAFPRGTEDEALGRLMTANMKYAMDIARGAHHLHQGFRKGLIGGEVIFEVGHSYDFTDDLLEGDIVIDVLEQNTWGCEPGARRYDRNDADWQYKLVWKSIDDACRLWPQHADSLLKSVGNRDWIKSDPVLSGVPQHLLDELIDQEGRVRVLEYWYRVPVEVSLVVNTATGDVRRFDKETDAEAEIRRIFDTAGATIASQYTIEKAKSQSALRNTTTGEYQTFRKPEHAEQQLDMIRQQAGKQAASQFEIVTRNTTALRVSNVTGWELLDDGPAPYGVDWRYPFARFVCYQDTDDINDIKGVVEDIKDPQREINWHHSTMLDTLVRGPKGGIWLNKGDNVEIEKLRQQYSRAGFIGEYSGQPPIPVQPQLLSDGDMAMLQFGIDMIMRISNINAEMMGQTTQKTVSGRAIQSRQAGGLVGVNSLLLNWTETKTLIGELLIRRIQQFYSPEKMDRIIGTEQRKLQEMGIFGPQVIPNEVLFQQFKQLKEIDMEVVVSFQEANPTARAGIASQMLQYKAAGAPIPMELIIETSDIPYKAEIKAALAKQGEQPPNPNLAQAVSAGQGQSAPSGVNTSA